MDKGESAKRKLHKQEGRTKITVFNDVMPCSLEEKYFKTEATGSSKTSILFYQTTMLHNPKEYLIIRADFVNRPISHPTSTGVSFPSGKTPGDKDDHSSPLVKNARSCTFAHAFAAWCLLLRLMFIYIYM
jgi:hypothetical protein